MIWYTLAYWLLMVIAIVTSASAIGLLFAALDYESIRKAVQSFSLVLLAIILWWAIWVIYPSTALAA